MKTIHLLSILSLGVFMLSAGPAFSKCIEEDCTPVYTDPQTDGKDDKKVSNGGWEKAVKQCEYGKPKCKKAAE